jgi:hypothetical protein
VLRDSSGDVQVEHDRHVEGLFPRSTWLRLLDEAGFEARAVPLEHSEVEAGVHETIPWEGGFADMKLSHTVPVFASADVEATLDFCERTLGFTRQWTEGTPPTDAAVRRDGAGLIFFLDPELAEKARGITAIIFLTGVEELYAEHQERGAPIIVPINDNDGLRSVRGGAAARIPAAFRRGAGADRTPNGAVIEYLRTQPLFCAVPFPCSLFPELINAPYRDALHASRTSFRCPVAGTCRPPRSCRRAEGDRRPQRGVDHGREQG